MTDYMNQDEAMNMTNDQAVQILEPLRDMMRDQHGCPISDAYFAIDKAIQALKLLQITQCKKCVFWDTDTIRQNSNDVACADWFCVDGVMKMEEVRDGYDRQTDGD